MDDENKKLNVQEIIQLVEKKPVLWDHRLELFKHRSATLAAWDEICWDYNKEYGSLSETEKINYRDIIIRKWRNVKDSWRKSLIKTVKGESGHKRYVYYKELLFLKQGMKFKTRNKSKKSQPKKDTLITGDDNNSSWHSEIQIKSEPIDKDLKKEIDSVRDETNYDMSTSKSEFYDKEDIYHEMPSFSYSQGTMSNNGDSELSQLSNSRQVQEDRHISFIKGVLPSLRTFNESQVVKFQIGVLQFIQNIQENSS